LAQAPFDVQRIINRDQRRLLQRHLATAAMAPPSALVTVGKQGIAAACLCGSDVAAGRSSTQRLPH
jgi:hypothetical protein